MVNHNKNPFDDSDKYIDDYSSIDKPDYPVDLIVACREFDAKFKTNSDCIEELVKILGSKYLYCRYCNSREVRRSFGSRTLICFACRRGSSVFTDTIYDGIKKPRAWLLANWLIGQGVEFNSNQFRIPARVAYSSALTIIKKLAIIIKSDLENEVEAIGSNMFLAIFNKRSSLTPAKEHPSSEQYEMEKSQAYLEDVVEDRFLDDEPIRPTCLEELSEFDKRLYEYLSDDKLHFDQLIYQLQCSVGELCSAIFSLEMLDLIQRHGGDYYTRKRIHTKIEIQKSLDNAKVRDFIDYIRTLYHGISRKCLHLYLALFWSKNHRVRWNRSALAEACRKHPPIKGKEVVSFVTPLVVNLVVQNLT